jgi:hypothetical protein
MRDKRRQRRHEPAGAAPGDALSAHTGRTRSGPRLETTISFRRAATAVSLGSFTNRRREPAAPGPPPISTSSAIGG